MSQDREASQDREQLDLAPKPQDEVVEVDAGVSQTITKRHFGVCRLESSARARVNDIIVTSHSKVQATVPARAQRLRAAVSMS